MSGGAAGGYQERTVSAQDGLHLYCRDYGDPYSAATPLLCLAGLTRNSRDFHHLAQRFSAERRVVTMDYRGRGRSAYDRDERNYRPEIYVSDALQVRIALGLEQMVLVGTSLGGLLSLGLAAVQPTAVAGIIMNDIGPELGPGLSRIRQYVSRDHPQPDWESAIAFVRTNFPGMDAMTDDHWRDTAEATYRQGDDGLLHYDWDIRISRHMQTDAEIPDLWRLFRAASRIPLLVLRGANSDVLTEATLIKMHEAAPHMNSAVVPGTAHAPGLTEDAALAAIHDFLSRIET